MINTLIDICLCAGIIMIATMSLTSQYLFKAIVLFMCFGILVTLAWVRLNAWDIAIAEAAIGAGITGVLLLVSLKPNSVPKKQTEL